MRTPIRLAIAGVGNCASSLVQGLSYYKDADPTETVPGLMHVDLGGYHIRDVVPVVAFDVDQAKVGTDLGKAIHAGHNNTVRFAEVGELGVTVLRGPTLDGLGKYYKEVVEESPAEPVDVTAARPTTPAASRCGSPLPGTWRRRPGWPCWSGDGRCSCSGSEKPSPEPGPTWTLTPAASSSTPPTA